MILGPAGARSVSVLGKVKILAKKSLKKTVTFIGGLGTSRRYRLFPKVMKHLAIGKHNSFPVVIKTCPVPVQLKSSFRKP